MNKFLIALSLVLFTTQSFAKEILLGTGNTITIRTDINPDSVSKAMQDLAFLDSVRAGRDYPIYLVLDSPGGDIYFGNSFIEFARTYKNIHTVSIFAASMASAIVEALPGKRYVTATGILMFHRAYGSFQGYFNDGEVEAQLAFWKSVVGSMEAQNASRIGISDAEYKQKVQGEWWIFGAQNVKQGTVDEVVSLRCTKALIKGREKVSVSGMFGSRTFEFSTCPLIQTPVR